jgi:transcriptional regulator with XRE-family HTH domain
MAERDAINAHIAQRLREARAGLKIDQATLAEHLGTSQAAISLWENGERRPDIATLDELAAGLGKPLSYFLDWPR